MSEYDEQVCVCDYLSRKYPDALYWSTPNGAHVAGNAQQRAIHINRLKRTGMRPGVADLIVFEPRGKYSCLFIEMKTETGKPSPEQLAFILAVENRGAFGAIAKGAEEAMKVIDDYFSLGSGVSPNGEREG